MRNSRQETRDKLLAIIRTQQAEIDALRGRVAVLEAEDVGQLRRRVRDLEEWKSQAETRIRDLEAKAAMTQGLVSFIGGAIVALLGERLIEVLQALPIEQLEEKLRDEMGAKFAEFEAQLGSEFTKFLRVLERVDTLSLEAWERQRKVLFRRVSTLPPLKRSLYKALDRLAAPSGLGSLLLDVLLTSEDILEKITSDEVRKLEALAAFLDTLSNLWPLTATNSLAPLLKHVGFDEAADAAAEILDSLRMSGDVPRVAVQKVRSDLVAMGVIETSTKPQTIIEYLITGHQLHEKACSPDVAASFGYIHSSATNLKRARRAFDGVVQLYNRSVDYPSDVSLDELETFGQSVKRLADEKLIEFRDLVALEVE